MAATTGLSNRPACLLVAGTHEYGYSAPSFVLALKITSSMFRVDVATPNAEAPKFHSMNDKCQKYLDTYTNGQGLKPIGLETADPNLYSALLLPSGLAALCDLSANQTLGKIVVDYIRQEKVICAIGCGVAGLLPANQCDGQWALAHYCVTGTTVHEISLLPQFVNLPFMVEDEIKIKLGVFSGSQPGVSHVVVDRRVVTGQNEASTQCAVQNMVLLHNTPRGAQ